jgi:hypothetical protein
MTETTVIAVVAGIGIPMLSFLIIISVRWGTLNATIASINKQLLNIVKEKDEMHQQIVQQMGEDRKATDRRLRFLEEWHMRHDKP